MKSSIAVASIVVIASLSSAAEPAKVKPREALQPFNFLIGSWKGTGMPEGNREEKDKGWWTERITWAWQFKGDDAWLTATFETGKYYAKAELHPLPDAGKFRLIVQTSAKEMQTLEGELKDKKLTLERTDDKSKETQRLTFQLLHSNRYLYLYHVRPEGKSSFVKKYQVGATKEGEAFAVTGNSEKECPVSGGLGTIPVTYNGKTYYVCCSGCRDEFKANPEKYVKEFEEKRKKEKGK
jgi:YHS domain